MRAGNRISQAVDISIKAGQQYDAHYVRHEHNATGSHHMLLMLT
jgi:hypothetical protein